MSPVWLACSPGSLCSRTTVRKVSCLHCACLRYWLMISRNETCARPGGVSWCRAAGDERKEALVGGGELAQLRPACCGLQWPAAAAAHLLQPVDLGEAVQRAQQHLVQVAAVEEARLLVQRVLQHVVAALQHLLPVQRAEVHALRQRDQPEGAQLEHLGGAGGRWWGVWGSGRGRCRAGEQQHHTRRRISRQSMCQPAALSSATTPGGGGGGRGGMQARRARRAARTFLKN
jgi:hypothetical protein